MQQRTHLSLTLVVASLFVLSLISRWPTRPAVSPVRLEVDDFAASGTELSPESRRLWQQLERPAGSAGSQIELEIHAGLADTSWRVALAAYRRAREQTAELRGDAGGLAAQRCADPQNSTTGLGWDEVQAKENLIDLLIADIEFAQIAASAEFLARAARDTAIRASARARALALLVKRFPRAAPAVCEAALTDGSQLVRLTALQAFDARCSATTRDQIRALVRDARPAVRDAAINTLTRIGEPAPSIDRPIAPLKIARALSARLLRADLRTRDILTELGGPPAEEIDVQWLVRRAERYLDASDADKAVETRTVGMMLLTSAIFAEEEKLARRVFDQLMTVSDSDDELLDAVFHALVSRRITRGLALYRAGDAAGALTELAALPRIAAEQPTTTRRDHFLRHGATLSMTIWRGTLQSETGGVGKHDAVRQLADRVWNGLDPNASRDGRSAERRYGAMCCTGDRKTPTSAN